MDSATRDFTGAPEHLIALAQQGQLSKELLVGLLAREKRQAYLNACTAIEKGFTEDCTASGDPCLEGGCALEGDICLQPLLRWHSDYLKACGQEWARLFVDPRNRSDTWRTQ